MGGCSVKRDDKEKELPNSTSLPTNTSSENPLHTTVPTTHFSYSQDYSITESDEVYMHLPTLCILLML